MIKWLKEWGGTVAFLLMMWAAMVFAFALGRDALGSELPTTVPSIMEMETNLPDDMASRHMAAMTLHFPQTMGMNSVGGLRFAPCRAPEDGELYQLAVPILSKIEEDLWKYALDEGIGSESVVLAFYEELFKDDSEAQTYAINHMQLIFRDCGQVFDKIGKMSV